MCVLVPGSRWSDMFPHLNMLDGKEVQDEEDQSLLQLQRQIEVISAKNRQRLAGAAQRHANR